MLSDIRFCFSLNQEPPIYSLEQPSPQILMLFTIYALIDGAYFQPDTQSELNNSGASLLLSDTQSIVSVGKAVYLQR